MREPCVEIVNLFLRISAIFFWNPFVVQVRIALPLDQELNLPSTHPGIEDSLDFVLYMVIDALRRGWGRSSLRGKGRWCYELATPALGIALRAGRYGVMHLTHVFFIFLFSFSFSSRVHWAVGHPSSADGLGLHFFYCA